MWNFSANILIFVIFNPLIPEKKLLGLYFAGALSWPLNGTFVAESGSAEERGFSSFATKCLEKHNAYRNLHKNTPKMTLDQTLQDGAQVNSHAVGMTFELTPFCSRNGRIIWNLLVNSNIHLQVSGQVRNGYKLSYIFRLDFLKNRVIFFEPKLGRKSRLPSGLSRGGLCRRIREWNVVQWNSVLWLENRNPNQRFFTTLRNFICIKTFAENNRFHFEATKNKRLDILLNLSGMIL